MKRLLPVTLITALIVGLMVCAASAQISGIPDTSAVMRDIQNQAAWQTYGALRSVENDWLRWYYYPYYSYPYYPYYWGRPAVIPRPIPRTQPGRSTPGPMNRAPATVVFPP